MLQVIVQLVTDAQNKKNPKKEIFNDDPNSGAKYPRKIFDMDWVAVFTPDGDRSFHACIVSVDRDSENPMFLPFHRDDTAMGTVRMIWNRGFFHTG
ncbi:hypothetical protein O181_025815 [Austropuccinia psidii MF-1]|uniref:Uncharacterized protein n=1 Tax=Austropuccinia psidii MF-1 TaxID=1389203 RepID=A0A9Q3H1K4_9BASI|nr:hypothetical protein [Austropuccinia psidii MF-1]